MKYITIALLSILTVLSSCSVVMAARKDGTCVENVQTAYTRGQVLSFNPVVVSSEKLENGEIIEVYQFKKEQGSAARAFMHGMLDVATCGIWEVFGTPIEVILRENKCFVVKVYYDMNEIVQKIELM